MPVIALIIGSVRRRRHRRDSVVTFASVRGETCWLMSTRSGLSPISSAK